MREDRTVRVTTFQNEFEAEVAREALATHDIDCIITRDNGGGMFPFIAFGRGISLIVMESDLEHAKKNLEKKEPEDD